MHSYPRIKSYHEHVRIVSIDTILELRRGWNCIIRLPFSDPIRKLIDI